MEATCWWRLVMNMEICGATQSICGGTNETNMWEYAKKEQEQNNENK